MVTILINLPFYWQGACLPMCALRTLPQIHFSGDADKTVPPTVARRFQRAVGGHCTQVDVVSGMAHGSDWAAIWPQLLAKALTPAGDHSSCVL